jgi:serine/threonine protein kinase
MRANITEKTEVGTGSFIGTPAYAAPEIVASKTVDHRADLFSLGVVLYEMLARQNPFRSGTLKATNDRILHDAPLSVRKCNPAVPRRVERIIGKLLEKDPANRYATAAELLKDLNGVVIARRRKGLYKVVMILAILCLAITVVFTVSKNLRPSSTKPTSLPTRKNSRHLTFQRRWRNSRKQGVQRRSCRNPHGQTDTDDAFSGPPSRCG